MSLRSSSAAPRVTIRDVAALANVHVSTVSRALDPTKASLLAEATRARVLAAAEELGYTPDLVASGLRRGRTSTVGVVVPDLCNPIYAPLAGGAMHALEKRGYMPLVADTQDDHRRFDRILDHLTERRVDAIITTAARIDDVDKLLVVRRQGTPVVTAVRVVGAPEIPSVFHDDAAGGRLAADHLIALGHRRLAQVEGPLDVSPFLARSQGFRDGVEAAGATLLPGPAPASDPTVAEGRRAAMDLFDREASARPTAVFVQNDLMALGALEALRDLGLRCPQDVSIVGYNDAFFAAHSCPPLTSVRLDSYEIGREAGRVAVEALDDPDGEQLPASIPPVLTVRESTASPAEPGPGTDTR